MDDGHECFLAKGLSTDMVNLAKICQKMSKFPKVRQFGGTFVKDKHYLYTALEYLNHGIASEGLHDCQLANQLASCLYDLSGKSLIISNPSSLNRFGIMIASVNNKNNSGQLFRTIYSYMVSRFPNFFLQSRDWVYNMLLFELENKAYEEDFAFKGKSFIVK
jgi:hypothetical protein